MGRTASKEVIQVHSYAYQENRNMFTTQSKC